MIVTSPFSRTSEGTVTQLPVLVLMHYPQNVNCLMKQAVVALCVFPLHLISREAKEKRDTNTTAGV